MCRIPRDGQDGELQMMLGARLRALGGTVPKDVLKDIRLLKQLGNRECHDNDQRHRLQDAQKLEVVETTSRLGAAAVEGRFACRPKREERLCRNWVQGGSCKHGYHCAFKHASKCRYAAARRFFRGEMSHHTALSIVMQHVRHSILSGEALRVMVAG